MAQLQDTSIFSEILTSSRHHFSIKHHLFTLLQYPLKHLILETSGFISQFLWKMEEGGCLYLYIHKHVCEEKQEYAMEVRDGVISYKHI